jgi:phosphoserine phosphatase
MAGTLRPRFAGTSFARPTALRYSHGMTHVATLISNPARPALDDANIAVAVGVLATAQAPRVLDSGIAVDIPFTPGGADDKAVAERLRAALKDVAVDVVVQPLAARRKRLFVADMDSTMIGQECIDELADLVGLKAHVAAITERAMRGEIDFEPALRERVALLKGLPASVVADVIAKRITLTPGGRELVNTMRQNGAYTCLVSGGFTLFTGPLSRTIGFNEDRGNILMVEDGKLSGRVAEPILGREAKLATLVELRERLGLSAQDTLAIGDGANDLAMIEAAGLGVAYHAKPKVAAAAHARIDHGDLTALLYCQGYARAAFAA